VEPLLQGRDPWHPSSVGPAMRILVVPVVLCTVEINQHRCTQYSSYIYMYICSYWRATVFSFKYLYFTHIWVVRTDILMLVPIHNKHTFMPPSVRIFMCLNVQHPLL
jgi:hypothetical protein